MGVNELHSLIIILLENQQYKLSFTPYSLCQKKRTINSLFFCSPQGEMGPEIDLVDYVYGSFKYAQFFWYSNLELFFR